MTRDELIAKQQLRIAELEAELDRAYGAIDRIYNVIYCVGGPLNDNKLGYTREQQKEWGLVAKELA